MSLLEVVYSFYDVCAISRRRTVSFPREIITTTILHYKTVNKSISIINNDKILAQSNCILANSSPKWPHHPKDHMNHTPNNSQYHPFIKPETHKCSLLITKQNSLEVNFNFKPSEKPLKCAKYASTVSLPCFYVENVYRYDPPMKWSCLVGDHSSQQCCRLTSMQLA